MGSPGWKLYFKNGIGPLISIDNACDKCIWWNNLIIPNFGFYGQKLFPPLLCYSYPCGKSCSLELNSLYNLAIATLGSHSSCFVSLLIIVGSLLLITRLQCVQGVVLMVGLHTREGRNGGCVINCSGGGGGGKTMPGPITLSQSLSGHFRMWSMPQHTLLSEMSIHPL